MSSDVIRNVTDILLSKADDHDHDHGDEDSNDKTAANIAKLVTIIALFIISMGSGMIPMFASNFFNWTDPSRDPRASVLISSLLSFGGGALLCTTFMHLLPEIDESISHLQEDGHLPSWEFSITNLLMAIGFFVIYLVEEIVHVYLRKQQKKQANEHAFVRGHSARESLREASIQREESRKQSAPSTLMTVSTAELVTNENNGHHHHHHSHGHNHHHHSHIPSIDGNDLLVSSIRGLLIVLALSVHELFEGLAVGLEQTTSNVWYLFASVAAHKVVIAFCIGVELLVHKTRRWLVILYIFIYAIVSPLGIAIGIWLSNSDESDGFVVASVILQGLASGTLLYVIFFEILSKHKDGIIQFLAVVVGFTLMFGLKFVGKEKLKTILK
jgi:solute carrier family 39 (zinc transporter), member 1/2/3